MTDNIVLDVIIGLIFVYLLLSLICSAIQEMVATLTKLRGNTLQKGIKILLDDPNIEDLAGNIRDLKKEVYEHPLVATLAKAGKNPSYIPARNFVIALLDVLKDPAANTGPLAEAKNTISGLPDGPLKSALTGFIDDAGSNLEQVRKNLETWFDNSMDRVSGWYKRSSQIIMLSIASVLAVSMNVDSIEMAKTLWQDPVLRAQVVAAAEQHYRETNAEEESKEPALRAQEVAAAEQYVGETASEVESKDPILPAPVVAAAEQYVGETASEVKPPTIKELKETLDKLPVGWDKDTWPSKDLKRMALKILGWILTAIAVSLGAPFWFDGLGRVLKIRSAGSRPAPTGSTTT